MTTPTDITMKTEDVLRVELEVFRHEHRGIDPNWHGRSTDPQAIKKEKTSIKRYDHAD